MDAEDGDAPKWTQLSAQPGATKELLLLRRRRLEFTYLAYKQRIAQPTSFLPPPPAAQLARGPVPLPLPLDSVGGALLASQPGLPPQPPTPGPRSSNRTSVDQPQARDTPGLLQPAQQPLQADRDPELGPSPRAWDGLDSPGHDAKAHVSLRISAGVAGAVKGAPGDPGPDPHGQAHPQPHPLAHPHAHTHAQTHAHPLGIGTWCQSEGDECTGAAPAAAWTNEPAANAAWEVAGAGLNGQDQTGQQPGLHQRAGRPIQQLLLALSQSHPTHRHLGPGPGPPPGLEDDEPGDAGAEEPGAGQGEMAWVPDSAAAAAAADNAHGDSNGGGHIGMGTAAGGLKRAQEEAEEVEDDEDDDVVFVGCTPAPAPSPQNGGDAAAGFGARGGGGGAGGGFGSWAAGTGQRSSQRGSQGGAARSAGKQRSILVFLRGGSAGPAVVAGGGKGSQRQRGNSNSNGNGSSLFNAQRPPQAPWQPPSGPVLAQTAAPGAVAGHAADPHRSAAPLGAGAATGAAAAASDPAEIPNGQDQVPAPQPTSQPGPGQAQVSTQAQTQTQTQQGSAASAGADGAAPRRMGGSLFGRAGSGSLRLAAGRVSSSVAAGGAGETTGDAGAVAMEVDGEEDEDEEVVVVGMGRSNSQRSQRRGRHGASRAGRLVPAAVAAVGLPPLPPGSHAAGIENNGADGGGSGGGGGGLGPDPMGVQVGSAAGCGVGSVSLAGLLPAVEPPRPVGRVGSAAHGTLGAGGEVDWVPASVSCSAGTRDQTGPQQDQAQQAPGPTQDQARTGAGPELGPGPDPEGPTLGGSGEPGSLGFVPDSMEGLAAAPSLAAAGGAVSDGAPDGAADAGGCDGGDADDSGDRMDAGAAGARDGGGSGGGSPAAEQFVVPETPLSATQAEAPPLASAGHRPAVAPRPREGDAPEATPLPTRRPVGLLPGALMVAATPTPGPAGGRAGVRGAVCGADTTPLGSDLGRSGGGGGPLSAPCSAALGSAAAGGSGGGSVLPCAAASPGTAAATADKPVVVHHEPPARHWADADGAIAAGGGGGGSSELLHPGRVLEVQLATAAAAPGGQESIGDGDGGGGVTYLACLVEDAAPAAATAAAAPAEGDRTPLHHSAGSASAAAATVVPDSTLKPSLRWRSPQSSTAPPPAAQRRRGLTLCTWALPRDGRQPPFLHSTLRLSAAAATSGDGSLSPSPAPGARLSPAFSRGGAAGPSSAAGGGGCLGQALRLLVHPTDREPVLLLASSLLDLALPGEGAGNGTSASPNATTGGAFAAPPRPASVAEAGLSGRCSDAGAGGAGGFLLHGGIPPKTRESVSPPATAATAAATAVATAGGGGAGVRLLRFRDGAWELAGTLAPPEGPPGASPPALSCLSCVPCPVLSPRRRREGAAAGLSNDADGGGRGSGGAAGGAAAGWCWQVAAAGDAGHGCVWRLRPDLSGATHSAVALPQARYKTRSLNNVVELAALPYNPRLLLGASSDGCVVLWDVGTARAPHPAAGAGAGAGVAAAASAAGWGKNGLGAGWPAADEAAAALAAPPAVALLTVAAPPGCVLRGIQPLATAPPPDGSGPVGLYDSDGEEEDCAAEAGPGLGLGPGAVAGPHQRAAFEAVTRGHPVAFLARLEDRRRAAAMPHVGFRGFSNGDGGSGGGDGKGGDRAVGVVVPAILRSEGLVVVGQPIGVEGVASLGVGPGGVLGVVGTEEGLVAAWDCVRGGVEAGWRMPVRVEAVALAEERGGRLRVVAAAGRRVLLAQA
ncbi:hypothetical protein HYH03_005726 [Edaphochlamys debaryana]|uniref:Uncharacterized protein n=1 Tax=Edaphochlamys debaryana TaxID=47281 RepID=A0A836C1Z1_9CHLO|nr:hypothetical protein HYH03_005726 [Edaphochlamys debaryana]|eukprot:KAG2496123.1 hypothetical protein HYH03_005726 [Edaphochlamys debaryana]